LIGSLERAIYIFAFMYAQPALITAVIILKAFFAWTHTGTNNNQADQNQAPTTTAATNPVTAANPATAPNPAAVTNANAPATPNAAQDQNSMLITIAHYHTYLIGNLLSLILAILLGLAATYWVPPLLAQLIKSYVC